MTEHCTIEDLGMSITGSDAPPMVAALNEYFHAFAKPVRCPPSIIFPGRSPLTLCIQCEKPLGGACGSFQWGLVHGEGQCSCGWPGRAYHRPTDADGEIFDRAFEFILQYHPEFVKSAAEA